MNEITHNYRLIELCQHFKSILASNTRPSALSFTLIPGPKTWSRNELIFLLIDYKYYLRTISSFYYIFIKYIGRYVGKYN